MSPMDITGQKKGAKDKMEKKVIKISLVGAILTVLIVITMIIAGIFIVRKVYTDRQHEAEITVEGNKSR